MQNWRSGTLVWRCPCIVMICISGTQMMWLLSTLEQGWDFILQLISILPAEAGCQSSKWSTWPESLQIFPWHSCEISTNTNRTDRKSLQGNCSKNEVMLVLPSSIPETHHANSYTSPFSFNHCHLAWQNGCINNRELLLGERERERGLRSFSHDIFSWFL